MSADDRAARTAAHRQDRTHRRAVAQGSHRVPRWEELTERQRSARTATAAECLDAAAAAGVVRRPAPRPTREHADALKAFLMHRYDELHDPQFRLGFASTGARALAGYRDLIMHAVVGVDMALNGSPEHAALGWSVRADEDWALCLRLAESFTDHPDYAPQRWTPTDGATR